MQDEEKLTWKKRIALAIIIAGCMTVGTIWGERIFIVMGTITLVIWMFVEREYSK